MSRARDRTLRRRLSITLVGVALVSVVLLASVDYVFARLLIDDSVASQLAQVRDTRLQAIDIGITRLQSRASTLASNPSVVEALSDFSAEFRQLEEDITPDQVAGLAAIYDAEVLPPFVAAGVDIPATDLVPESIAGRYVQQQYIASNPNPFDERDRLDDAGDGSGYDAAHAQHHPLLRELMDNAGMSDLLLVDADTGDVVYSTKKRIDLGTNGLSGPYASDGLGEVLNELSGVAVGDAAVSDSFFYIPTRGAPVFFLSAAVRSGSDVLGAVVTEVPVEAVTAVMTARQDWELLGLGDTGESYIVGADRTLRSNSRAWLEDPDDYLRRHVDRYGDQAAADLIETVGSPVLLQEVDNEATAAALDGEEFIGNVTDFLGTETLAASAPAEIPGLNWAVVVEQHRAESDSALDALVRALLIVLAVLLPTIALVGVFLARTLTRRADSLLQAAARIADGDLDVEVADLGRNELGDLGRQLEGVVRELEVREKAIVDEEHHINDMLTALLPARLVDRVRQGERAIEDIFDTATVISITLDDIPEGAGVDQVLALDITERLSEASRTLMDRYGVERIQRSSGSQLYVTGLAQDDAQVTQAVGFTFAAMQAVAEIAQEYGQPLTTRAGISAGDVATGVLGSTQLAFGVWGDPPSAAVTLGSLAQPGQVLADRNVVEELGEEWDVGPLEELPGLADDIDAYVIHGQVSVELGTPSDD